MNDKPDFGRRLREYRENMDEDLKALWKVWVPATAVNFAFMPMWARIPFTAGVSLVWTCILSAMRGGDVVHQDEISGAAVTGATYKMVKETVLSGNSSLFAASTVDLDKDKTHIVVSASGPDKAGWVAALARAVADQGGNVTLSKMVRLGNDFIILMHVAAPPEQTKSLMKNLKRHHALKGLNIQTTTLQRRETGKFAKAVMGVRVNCVGEDR